MAIFQKPCTTTEQDPRFGFEEIGTFFAQQTPEEMYFKKKRLSKIVVNSE